MTFDINTTSETISMVPVAAPTLFQDYRKSAFVVLHKQSYTAAAIPFNYVYGLISTPNMVPPYIYGVAETEINPEIPAYFVKIRNFNGVAVVDTDDLATKLKTWFDS